MLEGTARPNPMKKLLPILLIVAVLAGALFFMFPKHNQSLSFEMKFKPGQIDKYKMTMDMTMDMPNMPKAAGAPSKTTMNMTADITQEVVSVNPDGSAKIKASVSNMKMNMPGMPGGAMPDMPKTEFTMTMSKDGKVLSTEGMDDMPGMSGVDMKQMANQMSGSLPGKSVSVGDTWKSKVAMPIGGDMEVVNELVGENESIGGQKVSKIKSNFNYDGDLADWAKQTGQSAGKMPPGMKGKVSMKGEGNTFFNRAEGKMVQTDMAMDMTMNMEMPQGAMPGGQKSVNTNMNVNTNMKMKMRMEKVN
ncbi:MAG: hypothetical protein NT018_06145 [Armatimonadetes bacterium]|nr:hypothetical protein [Armatimonadota bacterium]